MKSRFILGIALVLACAAAVAQPKWQPAGPAPASKGQVEKIQDFEVVGAIQALVAHPTDANVVYAGAVNGGVWRTGDAMATSPRWQQLLDDAESLSIGALEMDPTDTTHRTLVAGMGRFSSYYRRGGALSGLQRTVDGGTTWTAIDGGGVLRGLNIHGIAARGSVIVLATRERGVLRSTDTGRTWDQPSGAILRDGPSFDMASDRADPKRLFTNGGAQGLYRSTDAGASWTRVSDAQMENLMRSGLSNVKIAVGPDASVYSAIVSYGRLAGLFRSADGGDTWVALDLPTTAESGGDKFGIHPGGQGEIHMSIAADPSDSNLVYVGGDRQPAFGEGRSGGQRDWPNSLGAVDYTGRIFRIDSTRPRGNQATAITHSHTASTSAPHADSRRLRFAANGVLFEADDGGVYRRSDPRASTGDWFSMNGDLQTGEFHSVAWDANSKTLTAGAQDTGTVQQQSPANKRWHSVSTGDGGIVAVDDTSATGFSVRYSSYYNLYSFRRQVFNAAGELQGETRIKPVLIGAANPMKPQFYTPIRLNAITASRLIIGAENSLYESLDQGDSITEIGPNIRANATGAIAYGTGGNVDLLFVGAGRRVYVRKAAHPDALALASSYPGSEDVVGITVDPRSAQTAFAIDSRNVFRTVDGGKNWTSIGAGLEAMKPGSLLAVAYSTSTRFPGLIVASDRGRLFRATGPAFSSWTRMDAGMPKAPVMSLEFNRKDMVLVAATLGRGAWLLDMK